MAPLGVIAIPLGPDPTLIVEDTLEFARFILEIFPEPLLVEYNHLLLGVTATDHGLTPTVMEPTTVKFESFIFFIWLALLIAMYAYSSFGSITMSLTCPRPFN